VQTVRMTN